MLLIRVSLIDVVTKLHSSNNVAVPELYPTVINYAQISSYHLRKVATKKVGSKKEVESVGI